MSFSINSVTSNGAVYPKEQTAAAGVSSEESNSFGNILAKAIQRCFADSIASYEEKQEAKEKEAAQQTTAAGVSAPANFQMSESMDAIFQEAANTYGVSVNLLKAVGMAESNFNPNAQSGAGAQGVMQLMPATAASLGVTNSFDARQNIMGGAKLLAQNLATYGGNIDLALAAYNAGPGNVAAYGGVPPFAETQNYVAKVKQLMGTELTTGQTVQTVRAAAPSAQASGESAADEKTKDAGVNFLADAVDRVRVQAKTI